MTKFLNISTDNTLGGSSSSDETVSSQKAIRDYINTNFAGLTNCIIDIPLNLKISRIQDTAIKLEAGSKVIVPNGVGSANVKVFNTVDISSDMTLSSFGESGVDEFLVYGNGNLYSVLTSQTTSGTTAPTDGLFYNTSTNIVSLYSDGTQIATNISVPLCMFSKIGQAVTGIKKVYNGFSYIGKSVFSFEGIVGLVPDGRESDNTLKTLKFTTQQCCVTTPPYTDESLVILINATQLTTYNKKSYVFDENKNTEVHTGYMLCGEFDFENNKIVNFKIKNMFLPVSSFELSEKQNTLVSGTNIKTINNQSILGSGNITVSELPSQSGNDGKFLSTNGTTLSWQKAIQNTATGANALTILGTAATTSGSINIGDSSTAGAYGIAIGSQAIADRGVAIGDKAQSYNNGAVAIGNQAGYGSGTVSGHFIGIGNNCGRDAGDKTVSIGYNVTSSKTGIITLGYGGSSTYYAGEVGETNAFYVVFNGTGYKLLDSTGIVPDGRISSNIARTSAIPTNVSDLNNDTGYITSSALSGYAKLDGNNTFTGVNSFELASYEVGDFILGQAPSIDKHAQWGFKDKNGVFTGCFENIYASAGHNFVQMAAKRPDGTENFAAFQVGYLSDNTEFASATPGVKANITNWAMPSDNYQNLTLGASGATYTAPANGYIRIDGTLNSVGGYLEIVQGIIDTTVQTPGSGNYTRQFLPVRKGNFVVNYAGFTAALFTFIYAVGG